MINLIGITIRPNRIEINRTVNRRGSVDKSFGIFGTFLSGLSLASLVILGMSIAECLMCKDSVFKVLLGKVR